MRGAPSLAKRGVLRPAIAVLLLVGVGVAAADRASAVCTGPRCCRTIDVADVDDGCGGDYIGGAALTPPQATVPVGVEGLAIVVAAGAPATTPRATLVLVEAPKTSPPG